MGEKKLNFNAPLMSVRRYATFSSSSSKGKSSKIVESSPSYRRHNLPPFEPDFNLDQVTEPVAVPFHWEHIPGRPKDDSEPKAPQHNASISPRAPPGKVFDVIKQPLEKDSSCQIGSKRQVKAYSFNDNNVMESKYSKEGKNERWRQELEDEDDVYSDAIDTLLSVESVSLKCSENGMSGCDGADLKPSGAFLRDPQTRDFMMRRFLPAAKAMTLDSPHYASKKQLVVIEQPKEVKHLRSEANRNKENERRSSVQVPYYNHHELEENEDEVDEYDVSRNISIKGCGFLPRLCLRNSLCLLNPVPGMKHKNQSHFSSTSKPSTASKTVKKDACEVAYKQKSERGFRSGELPLIKSNWGTEASRFRYSGELQRVRSSSPFGQSRSAGVSPYRNRPPQSPFGTLKEENIKVNKKFNSSNIGSNKFQEVLAHQRAKQGSISTSHTIEKTLYVDTVKIAAVPSSKSASLYAKRESDSDFDEFENLLEPKGQKEASPAECFSQYIKRLNTVEEPKVLCSADDKQILICEKSHLKGQPVIMDASGQGLGQKMKNLDNSNVNTSRAIVLKDDQLLKEQSGDFAQSPLPPPLPKSPSESWLWRTLPSIPLRNLSALTSNLGSTKRLECNTSSTSSKWETIVKTSYLHNDHTRYSEELIAHISRQSKA